MHITHTAMLCYQWDNIVAHNENVPQTDKTVRHETNITENKVMCFDQKVSESIDDENNDALVGLHAINVKILILPNVSSIMYTVDNIIDLEDTPYGL